MCKCFPDWAISQALAFSLPRIAAAVQGTVFKRQKRINTSEIAPKVPRAPDHFPDPQTNQAEGTLRPSLKPRPEDFPKQASDVHPEGGKHKSKAWGAGGGDDRKIDVTAESVGRLKYLGRIAGVTGLSPHIQLPQRGTVCQCPEPSGQGKGVIPEPKPNPSLIVLGTRKHWLSNESCH